MAESDDLLERAQQGERSALEELLRQQRGGMYRYGLQVCRTTEDAEDAVQETLVAATRHLGAVRRAAATTAWLFAIVRNYCFRLDLRRQDYVALEPLAPLLADPRMVVDEEAGTRELAELLAQGMSALSPTHRRVLVLRDVQGLSAPEAAAEMGLSVGALKSLLHRARGELRASVEASLS